MGTSQADEKGKRLPAFLIAICLETVIINRNTVWSFCKAGEPVAQRAKEKLILILIIVLFCASAGVPLHLSEIVKQSSEMASQAFWNDHMGMPLPEAVKEERTASMQTFLLPSGAQSSGRSFQRLFMRFFLRIVLAVSLSGICKAPTADLREILFIPLTFSLCFIISYILSLSRYDRASLRG